MIPNDDNDDDTATSLSNDNEAAAAAALNNRLEEETDDANNNILQQDENQTSDNHNHHTPGTMETRNDIFLSAQERYEIWLVKAAERPELLETYNKNQDDDYDEDDYDQEQQDKQEEPNTDTTVDDDNDENVNDNDTGSISTTESQLPPAITDGCDIPAWRQQGLMTTTSTVDQQQGHKSSSSSLSSSIWGVGAGCPLLRRERQLPLTAAAVDAAFGRRCDDPTTATTIAETKTTTTTTNRWKSLQARLFQTPLVTPGTGVVPFGDDKNHTAVANETSVEIQRLEPMVLDYENDILEPMGLNRNHSDDDKRFSSKEKQSTSTPRRQRTHKDAPPPFEQQSIPALIQGCCTATASPWNMTQLTWHSLVQNYGHVEWRFSDTHAAGMTLQTYQAYCRNPWDGASALVDDAPLAVYDSQFHADERAALLQHFTVPACFDYDLFDYLPEDDEIDEDIDGDHNDDDDSASDSNRYNEIEEDKKDDEDEDSLASDDEDGEDENGSRPPYRWILMGPERSGTGLHVDPIGTHAWVTLIEGCKRWILFPPETPPQAIGLRTEVDTGQQVPSVVWFEQWWCNGTILDYYKRQQQQDPQNSETLRYVDFLQRPGETIYVPSGWPHLVLNLEQSVAVTQNYATEYPSFSRFITAVEAEGTPQQIANLRKALAQHRPDLQA